MTDAPLASHRKFGFDTEFDDAGGIASAPPPVRRFYSPEEVEHMVQQAAADAEARAHASIQGRTSQALDAIALCVRAALGSLAEASHEHRVGAAELALACGRTIAGAAFEQFPQAPAAAALEALARELESSPRLTVRAPADVLEAVQAALDTTAQSVGYTGQIRCVADPSMPPAAFSFDWGDGRAAFDPVQASARVGDALAAALAAEGLHGEAISSPES